MGDRGGEGRHDGRESRKRRRGFGKAHIASARDEAQERHGHGAAWPSSASRNAG